MDKPVNSINTSPIADLVRDLIREQNVKISELIQAIALPDSNCLKVQLNSSWYLNENQDVAQAGVDPYVHWLKSGMTEGRLPASDLIAFVRELAAEREQALRLASEEQERALRRLQHESHEREKVLDAEIVQTKLKVRDEIEAQLRTLAEREQAFRLASEEQERALGRLQHESHEREKVLDAEIVQTKLKARDEIEAQLRTLAERERAFAEQLTQLQHAVSEEWAAQMEAGQLQMAALA